MYRVRTLELRYTTDWWKEHAPLKPHASQAPGLCRRSDDRRLPHRRRRPAYMYQPRRSGTTTHGPHLDDDSWP